MAKASRFLKNLTNEFEQNRGGGQSYNYSNNNSNKNPYVKYELDGASRFLTGMTAANREKAEEQRQQYGSSYTQPTYTYSQTNRNGQTSGSTASTSNGYNANKVNDLISWSKNVRGADASSIEDLTKQAQEFQDYFTQNSSKYDKKTLNTVQSILKNGQNTLQMNGGKTMQAQQTQGFNRLQPNQDVGSYEGQIRQLEKEKQDLYPEYSQIFSIQQARDAGDTKAVAVYDRYTEIDEQIAQLRSQNEELKRQNRLQGYNSLTKNADFAENSQYRSTVKQGDSKNDWMNYLPGSSGDDLNFSADEEYERVNQNRDIVGRIDQNTITQQAAATGGSFDDTQNMHVEDDMTDEERAIYNYLYATKGKAEASKYLEDLRPDLNKRYAAGQSEFNKQLADDYPVLASAITILDKPVVGFRGLAAQLGTAAVGGQIDPYDPAYTYNRMNTEIRSEVGQNIADAAGGGTKGEIANMGYQTFMSMMDNLYGMALGGGFSAGGNEILQQEAESFILTTMGTDAASTSMIEQLQNGVSQERAVILGACAGAAEILTEKIGLDNLFNSNWTGSREAFKSLARQIFSEGTEEGLADIMNWTMDDLYDAITSQNVSEWHRAVAEYQAQGYTESEAMGLALKDRMKELGMDVGGGALSGGFMGGGFAAANNISFRQNNAQTAEAVAQDEESMQGLIESGLAAPEGSDSYKGALKLQEQIEQGQTPTKQQILNQMYRNEQQISAEEEGLAPITERTGAELAQNLMNPETNVQTESTQETQNQQREEIPQQTITPLLQKQNVPTGVSEALLERNKTEQKMDQDWDMVEAIANNYEKAGLNSISDAFIGFYNDNYNVIEYNNAVNTVAEAGLNGAKEFPNTILPTQVASEIFDLARNERSIRYGRQSETEPGTGTDSLRGYSGRLYSETSAERGSEVAEGTGRTNQEVRQTGLEGVRGSDNSQHTEIRTPGAGQKATARGLGLKNGTDDSNVTIVDVRTLSAADQEFSDLHAALGNRVHFFKDDSLTFNENGETFRVRGVIQTAADGSHDIFVRTDDQNYSASQIGYHESYHSYIDSLVKQTGKRRSAIVNQLYNEFESRYGVAIAKGAFLDSYKILYEKSGKAAWQIMEEMLADLAGNMNEIFASNQFMMDSIYGAQIQNAYESENQRFKEGFLQNPQTGSAETGQIFESRELSVHGLDADFAECKYSIAPPYNGNQKTKLNTWLDGLSDTQRHYYDVFEAVRQIGRRRMGGRNWVNKFMLASEWNENMNTSESFRSMAQAVADSIPKEWRSDWLKDDGTIIETPFEKQFKMQRSIMQRIVDKLPSTPTSSKVTIDGTEITLSDKNTIKGVGGEEYRQAIYQERLELYNRGELPKKSLKGFRKDTWGTLGFLATNQKTGASGDFTTFCPQMYYNNGCFYCYRRAALESGVNNKLVGESVWYTGEILMLKQEDIDMLNGRGGLRIQSFGDWMEQYSPQLAQMLADADRVGLQIKIITKEPSMIDVVARIKNAGIGKSLYFNLSSDYAIERAGSASQVKSGGADALNPMRPYMRDAKGDMWWKRALTVEEANEYRNKYPWVNTRIVATTLDEFIRGLKSDMVDVVTGYHGNIRQYERISSETGETLVQMEALGDAGMPRFAFDAKTGEWTIEYEGKTKTHQALAKRIQEEGLEYEYYIKSCCITGRCAECKGKCGQLARDFNIKNATNRDEESVAYWQEHMQSADENSTFFSRDFQQRDSEYMELAKDPEKNEARLRELVEQAAREAGYDTSNILYHGTNAEFNEFMSGWGQYGPGIYLTYDRETAATYGSRVVSLYTKPLRVADWSDIGDIVGIDNLDEYWDSIDYSEDDDITSLEEHPELMDALEAKGYNAFEDDGNSGVVLFDAEGVSSMVKSADPVTYDNDGNVIPLSERFNQENQDIRYSRENSPAFYSQLERMVEAYKGDKIGASSLIPYLKGKGIKDEEIKWTGVRTFLEGKKSVSKSDLIQYVKDNQLQVEETVLTRNPTSSIWTNGVSTVNMDYYYDYNGQEFKDEEEFKIAAIKAAEDDGFAENDIEFNIDHDAGYMEAVLKDYNDTVLEAAHPDIYELRDSDFTNSTETKWHGYRVEGGTNYREILYKIPDSNYSNFSMKMHWNSNNTGVLAHARIQDFGDILFVEEIQSDWHNAGQVNGYRGEADENTIKDEYRKKAKEYREYKLSVYDTIIDQLSSLGYDTPSGALKLMTNGTETEWDISKRALKLHNASDKMVDQIEELRMRSKETTAAFIEMRRKINSLKNAVPDAPFRNTYTDFVLKDLLRKAADDGKKYLAWTTAQMQAERWSNDFMEGYRIEYDQDIPKFLKKYGKQWGAKLTEVELDTGNITYPDGNQRFDGGTVRYNVPAIEITDAMRESVLTQGQPMFSREVEKTYEQLEKEFNALKTENRKNAERAEYFKGETRLNVLSENPRLDTKQIEKAAKGYVKDYGLSMKTADLSKKLQKFAEDFHLGNKDFNQLANDVLPLANEIVRSAKVLTENPEREITEHIRKTKLLVSDKIRSDISDYGAWRRQYFGRMDLSTTNGTPVEDFYRELQDAYGMSLFPNEVMNPTDQLMVIATTVDELQPYRLDMMFDTDSMAEATNAVAMEIINDVMDMAPHKTFADKQKEARLNLKKEMQQKANDSLKAARADRDRRIQELKDHYKEIQQRRRIRKQESADRKALLRIGQRLDRMKTTKANRTVIEEMLGTLDLTAVSITDGRVERLKGLRAWYEEQFDDPDFLRDLGIEKAIARLEKKQISDMDIEDVRELTNILKVFEHKMRTDNKLIRDQDRRDVFLMGQQVIRNVSGSKGTKLGKLDDMFIAGTLTPERAIRRMTDYWDDDPLYLQTKKLSDGQRDMLSFQMRAGDMFKKWTADRKYLDRIMGRKAETIKIREGVEVTPAMVMSLYLHSLNDDNMRHIEVGGVRIPDMKLYKKGDLKEAYAKGKLVQFKKSQIQKLAETYLTENDRAAMRAISDYYNRMSQEAINDVSEDLYGFSLAEVENYFPINTDKNYTKGSDTYQDFIADSTIEGMGFLKERIKANNPIMLRDAFEVLTQSINDTSKFVGLAIPVRNFKKIMNVQLMSFEDAVDPMTGRDVRKMSSYDNSVKDVIGQKWGTRGQKYINDMLSDLEGNSRKSRSRINASLNKIRSNYAGAVLTLNLSVAMKQAASYPTAAAVLGWGPLVKAFGNTRLSGKVDLELIKKYTPLLWYRMQGYSTQELGDIAQSNNFMNRLVNNHKALNWIQAVDLMTTKKLWKASEYYVRDNFKDLEIGTDEYYKEVANIYNQVIEETQPNYTTMQRPDLLRDDNALLQSIMMFKTQPFQNFNVVFDAVGNYQAKVRHYNAVAGSNDKTAIRLAEAAKQQAGQRLRNAISAILVSTLVFAAMTFAYNMLRRKKDNYEDEDGNVTAKSIMTGIGKDMASSAAGMIPFGAEAWELASSQIFGEKYYGLNSVTITALSDMVTAGSNILNMVKDATATDEDGNPVEKTGEWWQNAGIRMEKNIQDIANAFGIPAANVRKVFNIPLAYGLDAKGEYLGGYEYMKFTKSIQSSHAEVYDLLYDAYKNDKKQFRAIYDDLVDNMGFKDTTIKTNMEKRMKEEAGVGSVKDLPERFTP